MNTKEDGSRIYGSLDVQTYNKKIGELQAHATSPK
jgi:hypothetical protein